MPSAGRPAATVCILAKRQRPLLDRYSTRTGHVLDVNRMQCAASHLIGEHDFKIICRLRPSESKHGQKPEVHQCLGPRRGSGQYRRRWLRILNKWSEILWVPLSTWVENIERLFGLKTYSKQRTGALQVPCAPTRTYSAGQLCKLAAWLRIVSRP